MTSPSLILDRYFCEVFVADGYASMTATCLPEAGRSRLVLWSESDLELSLSMAKIDVRSSVSRD